MYVDRIHNDVLNYARTDTYYFIEVHKTYVLDVAEKVKALFVDSKIIIMPTAGGKFEIMVDWT
jgi:hypothetical protein